MVSRGFTGTPTPNSFPNENYKEKSVASDHKTFQTRFLKPDGTLKPGGDYYGVKVHHVLANFREDNLAKPADFKLNHSVLQKFDGVPWGVGVAASGYHTFAIEGQNVHESHQGRNPQDPTNLEHRPWYELGFDDLAKGEWSREQSGVIVVPPGTFKD